MTDAFTPEEFSELSDKVDFQLKEIRASQVTLGTPVRGKSGIKVRTNLLTKQRATIEQVTGKNADDFLARLKRVARKDACEEGGVLYEQWNKWKDVTNKEVLKTFSGFLIALGLSGSALQVVLLAVTVYIIYLGLDAFCEDD